MTGQHSPPHPSLLPYALGRVHPCMALGDPAGSILPLISAPSSRPHPQHPGEGQGRLPYLSPVSRHHLRA